MKEKLYFTATGIGSMPFDESETAIGLIATNLNKIPHWPQLPKRSDKEHFVFQYLAPLVKIGLITVVEEKAPFIDGEAEDFPDKLTAFYELYLRAEEGEAEALQEFAFPKESAAGFYAFCEAVKHGEFPEAEFYKGQISGPLSVALNLTDQNRRSVYYDMQLRDVVIKTLALQAKWQAKTLSGLGKKAIIFIDDPSLYALGASTHITISKEEVVAELEDVISAIKETGALAGVHSCANVDWPVLLNSKIDFLSFDAYGYFDNLLIYPEEIINFLQRGGTLAWGIVPTSEEIFTEDAEKLKTKLEAQIAALVAKDVPEDLIYSNAVLTPSCGTGSLSPEMATKIYETLGQLNKLMK
jgi:hypothetical protein